MQREEAGAGTTRDDSGSSFMVGLGTMKMEEAEAEATRDIRRSRLRHERRPHREQHNYGQFSAGFRRIPPDSGGRPGRKRQCAPMTSREAVSSVVWTIQYVIRYTMHRFRPYSYSAIVCVLRSRNRGVGLDTSSKFQVAHPGWPGCAVMVFC